jgi:hypothetical protein
MSITLKLLESVGQIESNILSALSVQFNASMKSKKNKILQDIKTLIPFWISSQPEMQSLLSSDPLSLVGQFGITISPTAIVSAIVSSVVNSANILIIPYDKKLNGGGIELNIQPDNFANLLGLPQGHSVYQDGNLHWLDWLLNRGDEIIVAGYQYNPQTGIGRSKLGNMKTGGSFRVPPEFSGTEQNNFITRALVGSNQEKQISKIFETILSA